MQILYASIICAFVSWFGYGMYSFGIASPVVAGPLVGLLLGDLETGLIVGGTLTLVYLGVVAVGAAIPVNQTIATTVSVALIILTGVDNETAITLAVPVAVLGQLARMAAWTINSSLMHLGDKYAAADELDKISRLTWVGSAIFWIAEFIPVALVLFFSSNYVANLNEIMPLWLTGWLKTATGMLPALGFGMLFSMMYKPKYVGYLIIGFVFTAYFEANLQTVSLIGLALASFTYFKNQEVV